MTHDSHTSLRARRSSDPPHMLSRSERGYQSYRTGLIHNILETTSRPGFEGGLLDAMVHFDAAWELHGSTVFCTELRREAIISW
jgi:hypothetical protein